MPRRHPRTHTRHRAGIAGFTQIELLTALLIAALLFGFALPALSAATEATRAMQVRTALMASYQAALTGAASANSRTTLCPSSDGAHCTAGIDWSHGWIAFVDRDGDRERQPAETILAHQDALPGKVHLHSTAGRTRIEIQADGSVAGSNVTFTLCDGRGASRAQSLILSNKSTLRVAPADAMAIADTCAPG